MNVVILGLSITSSWGNGHATTYRALVRALAARGHDVLFLERDSTWYAENRDLPAPPYCRARLYASLDDLQNDHATDIEEADLVVLGSYVPEGIGVGDLVLRTARGCKAFYDIDTPVKLARLEGAGTTYIERRQIPDFDLYLSFAGGPTLDRLERRFRAQRARALYCSVDEELYSRAQADLRRSSGSLTFDLTIAVKETVEQGAHQYGFLVTTDEAEGDGLRSPDLALLDGLSTASVDITYRTTPVGPMGAARR